MSIQGWWRHMYVYDQDGLTQLLAKKDWLMQWTRRSLTRVPSKEGGPRLTKFESPRWRPNNNSSSGLTLSPGAFYLWLNAKAFRQSTYGRNDNFVDLSMALVAWINYFGVNRNCQNKWTPKIFLGVGLWIMYCVWAREVCVQGSP